MEYLSEEQQTAWASYTVTPPLQQLIRELAAHRIDVRPRDPREIEQVLNGMVEIAMEEQLPMPMPTRRPHEHWVIATWCPDPADPTNCITLRDQLLLPPHLEGDELQHVLDFVVDCWHSSFATLAQKRTDA